VDACVTTCSAVAVRTSRWKKITSKTSSWYDSCMHTHIHHIHTCIAHIYTYIANAYTKYMVAASILIVIFNSLLLLPFIHSVRTYARLFTWRIYCSCRTFCLLYELSYSHCACVCTSSIDRIYLVLLLSKTHWRTSARKSYLAGTMRTTARGVTNGLTPYDPWESIAHLIC
jgi:hypothetical protein